METQSAADRSETISTGFLDGARKNYPREFEYVLVAIALAFITGCGPKQAGAPGGGPGGPQGPMEVSVLTVTPAAVTLTQDLPAVETNVAILGYFFMHLKFDKPILTRLFYSGVILAIAVYCAAMAMLHGFRAGQH